MSLATREIVRGYRVALSARPDGKIHVVDTLGITHVVLDIHRAQMTACGVIVENDCDMHPLFVYESHGTRLAVPTWNDVDCMTCLARRRS